jgi:alkylation response protein AidB-like acyl-CoA dehydrogenase
MASPGITCRPLPELTEPDYADFNEVFFTDVEVPAFNLLGPLNGGWAITQGSLGHERSMLWIQHSTNIDRGLEALVADSIEMGFDGDPVFREALASLYIDGQAMRLLGYRAFAKTARGESSHEISLLKLFSSEIEQRLYLLGTEMAGVDGWDISHAGPPSNWRSGAWAVQYLRSFSGTIAGGTSEIQRNIIAERVLGLPRG